MAPELVKADIEAIQEIVEEMEIASNLRSGTAFAKFFADDADFINISAEFLSGKAAIANNNQEFYDSYCKNSKWSMKVRRIRPASEDCVVVTVDSNLDCPTGPLQGKQQILFSLVLSRFASDWKIISCHATIGSPETFTAEDVHKALEDARRYAALGEYERALERHLWYHRNADKIASGHGGVRVSFALANWAELGAVYPPAREALIATRDETIEEFRKKQKEVLLFGDAMSLTLALDDLKAAKELFYEAPDVAREWSGLNRHIDSILELGDIEWARDVIGDPDQALARIRHIHTMTMTIPNTEHKNMLSDFHARQVSSLVQNLVRLDNLETALRIQKDALLFLDSDIIREALDEQPL